MYSKTQTPGKFDGNRSQKLAETVYHASLDGCDDELGDVQDFGWYGLVRGKRFGFIICEDNNGFVDVDYGELEDINKDWQLLVQEYEGFLEEQEEDEA